MNHTQWAKNALISAAILGFLAVSIGAFGAHALASVLAENGRLATFDTASKYHFYHALALLFVASFQFVISMSADKQSKVGELLKWASIMMVLGIIVFSGSLYCLSLTNIAWLGAITPIGGILLLSAWGFILKASLVMKK